MEHTNKRRVVVATRKKFLGGDEAVSAKTCIQGTGGARPRRGRRPADDPEVHRVERGGASRAKGKLFDLLRSHPFELHLTLTLREGSDEERRLVVRRWLEELRRKHPTERHVVVPERHDSGGLHFHVVIMGVPRKALGLRGCGEPGYWRVGAWCRGSSRASMVWDPVGLARYLSEGFGVWVDGDTGEVRRNDEARRLWASKGLRPKWDTVTLPDTGGDALDTLVQAVADGEQPLGLDSLDGFRQTYRSPDGGYGVLRKRPNK